MKKNLVVLALLTGLFVFGSCDYRYYKARKAKHKKLAQKEKAKTKPTHTQEISETFFEKQSKQILDRNDSNRKSAQKEAEKVRQQNNASIQKSAEENVERNQSAKRRSSKHSGYFGFY